MEYVTADDMPEHTHTQSATSTSMSTSMSTNMRYPDDCSDCREQATNNGDSDSSLQFHTHCCIYFSADAAACSYTRSGVPPACPYVVKWQGIDDCMEPVDTAWPGDILIIVPLPQHVPGAQLPECAKATGGRYCLALNMRTKLLEPRLWSLGLVDMTCTRIGVGCISTLDGGMPGRMFEIVMQILWDAMRTMCMYQFMASDNAGNDELTIERWDLAAAVALVLRRRDLHLAAHGITD